MTDPHDGSGSDTTSPGTPVSGRYRIERELGRGGMATVYLARDLTHDRLVALKTLQPELSRAVGNDRFLREIAIAARLQHPNILPLFDSGTGVVGGETLWFYVMPYVAGESLRALLERETQLGLDDAIRICRQVAAALDHAHAQGIVHRDIKPENILLEGEQAVVADFGVATALDAAGGEKLTQTGICLGTPAYMSPEQATARRVDARSDVYSLACVLYEMLVGDPPFVGSSARAVLARHALDPVPSVRTARPEVPEYVEAALRRGLAKVPGDRFPSAGEFAETVAGAGLGMGASAPARTPRWRLAAAVAFGGLGLLAGSILLQRTSAPPLATGLDRRVVAVLPFRIDGADSALKYLGEGMVDLLAIKFTGEGGPRAADPRAVMSAWRNGAARNGLLSSDGLVRLAQRLVAGRVISGAVVGGPDHLTITAALIAMPSGETSARASVDGNADSLPTLVDRLAGDLLAGEAGESERRLTSMASLPALRAYLDGQAAYRLGHWSEAVRSFNRALQFDSTFALAAMGLASAALWAPDHADDVSRGRRLAWAARDRLDPRDRIFLSAKFGPLVTGAERLQSWERVVAATPDRPDGWYELGDQYLHMGAMLGVDSPTVRAAAAFERALALDSSAVGYQTFAEAILHLTQIAAAKGDSGAVRRLTKQALTSGIDLKEADFLRWQLAQVTADRLALDTLRTRLNQMDPASLHSILWLAQSDQLDAADAKQVAAAIDRRAVSSRERALAAILRVSTALNGGRPAEARAASQGLPDMILGHQFDFWDRYTAPIYAALYWGGDSSAGAAAARHLARLAETAPATGARERTRQYTALCAVEQWRLSHGDTRTTARTVERLTNADPAGDSLATVGFTHGCAALLTAWLATIQQTPQADSALQRMDSLMITGSVDWLSLAYANLVLARLHELRGDLHGALAAARRRISYCCTLAFLSSHLREEGRLAELNGDRKGALRAYRHYLRLHSDPEPVVLPEVQRLQEELEKLVGETRR